MNEATHELDDAQKRKINELMASSLPQDDIMPDKLNDSQDGKTPSKSFIISVPIEGPNGEIKQVLKEVHEYPAEAIVKTVEKSSYLTGNAVIEIASKKRLSKKSSQASVSSSKSSSSKRHSSLKGFPLNDKRGKKVSETSLDGVPSWFVNSYYRDRDTFSCVSSDNSFMPSETSSNISAFSDLSGYEDEYSAIKNLVSDLPHSQDLAIKALSEKKDSTSIVESLLHEQEAKIQELITTKEDLEIQLHRSSIQLQNSLREKDSLKEEIDLIKEKFTDVNHKQHFEVLKQKASLEGQLEASNKEMQKLIADKILVERALDEANASLKRHQIDKRHSSEVRNCLEKEKKDLVAANLNLKSKIAALNEDFSVSKSKLDKVSFELKKRHEEVEENSLKLIKNIEKVESSKLNEERMANELNELKKANEIYYIAKIEAENKFSEETLKIANLLNSNEWYKMQLSNSHMNQTELQKTLSDTKSTLVSVNSDAEKYKVEIQSLKTKIEEDRIQAVKEKSALLSHLEELEADMKEREAATLHDQENIRNIDRLKEDKIKKLEEDYKKYQKLRLDMSDVSRQKESLAEELQHKMSLAYKLEEEAKNLQKELAMTNEIVGERDVMISSVTHQLEKCKEQLEKSYETCKEKELQMSSLKVQNLKMEASLKSAESNRVAVDETVAKLKEDILRLSTNFYRMKHDLAAKDKQFEVIETENKRLSESKSELYSEIVNLKTQIQVASNDKVLKELKQSEIELSFKAEENGTEAMKCKLVIESLETEKTSLIDSLKTRDSQIEELVANLDHFKGKISQRESRLQILEKKCENIEKSYLDSSVRCSSMQKNLENLEQENIELIKLKQILQNKMADLEQNLSSERSVKETLEINLKKEMEKNQVENQNVHTQTCKEESPKRDFKNTKCMADLKQSNEMLRTKERKIETLLTQIKELKKEATLQRTNYEKSLRLNQVEIKKLQDSLVRYEKQANLKLGIASTSKTIQRPNRNTSTIKDSKIKELETLKHKHNTAILEISKKSQDISSLNDQISEQSQRMNSLSQANQAFECINEELQARVTELEGQIQNLSQTQQELHQELNICQSDLEEKTKFCEDWKSKYECLRDSIPEKDMNSPSTAANEKTDLFSESRVTALPETFEPNEKHSTNSTNCHNFDETMLDLQDQFALASEVLKQKDQQIMELKAIISEQELMIGSTAPTDSMKEAVYKEALANCQATKYTQTLFTQLNTHSLAAGSTSNLETHSKSSTSDYKLPTSPDLTQTISNSSQGTFTKENSHSKIDASTLTVENVSNFKENLIEKDSTIEVLTQKLKHLEISTQEKQKRYESNIRLLTKKLKEHMKGRRNCERQLEVIMQENERRIAKEKEQYKQLMNKHLALEQENQLAHLKSSSCEEKLQDMSSTLKKTDEELSKLTNQNLELQKKVSLLQELDKSNEKLESELKLLQEQMKVKSSSFDNLSHSLLLKEKELRSLTEDNLISMSKIKNLEVAIDEAASKMQDANSSSKDLNNQLDEQKKKIYSLEEKMRTLNQSNDDLEKLIAERDGVITSLKTSVHEITENTTNLKQTLGLKNQEFATAEAKIEILEREIKISEEKQQASLDEIQQLHCSRVKIEEEFKKSISSFGSQLHCAQAIEASLTEKLDQILKDKLFYQSQMTEFKMALNSALSHIQRLQSSSACIREMVPPSPMDIKDIRDLVRKSSEPPFSKPPLQSLTQCLSSIRREVSTLKMQARSQNRNDSCSLESDEASSSPLLNSSNEEKTSQEGNNAIQETCD